MSLNLPNPRRTTTTVQSVSTQQKALLKVSSSAGLGFCFSFLLSLLMALIFNLLAPAASSSFNLDRAKAVWGLRTGCGHTIFWWLCVGKLPAHNCRCCRHSFKTRWAREPQGGFCSCAISSHCFRDTETAWPTAFCCQGQFCNTYARQNRWLPRARRY